MRAGGIVVCGGRSHRMGRPKAMLPFGNEFLLQRVVRVLRGVVGPVVVVAAPGQELPDLPSDVRIVRDDREDLGPLNGLAAGLDALTGAADVAYLSACDVPFIRPAFVRRVLDRSAGVEVTMPEVAGFKHPLAAAYRLTVRSVVRILLEDDRRRVLDVTERCPTRFLGADDLADVDPGLDSLRNLNTPAEYERALWDLRVADDGESARVVKS